MFPAVHVYGPRMDVFGAYTSDDPLARTAGRGEPPVIFGDGLQTMDFIYVEDVAEAYLQGDGLGRQRRGLQTAEPAIETSLRDLCAPALRRRRPHRTSSQSSRPPRRQQRRAAAKPARKLARERVGFEAALCCQRG